MPAGEAVPLTMWLSQAGKTGHAIGAGQMIQFGPLQGSADDYVLRALAPLSESVQSLAAGYDVVQGLLSPTDKGAALVIATSAQVDAMLQPLWENATAQQLRLSFRHFKDAVLARNQTILEFNGYRSRYLAVRAELDSRQVEVDRLVGKSALSFDELRRSNQVFDALNRFIERTQHRALASIFAMARAYRSWAIQPDALDVLHWDPGAGFSAGDLKISYESWHDKVQDVIEQRAKAPTRLPGDVKHGTGIWIYLDESNAPDVIRQLRVFGMTTISIAPARRADTYADTPFHGLAEVQLLAFRPFIGGVRIKGNNVTVRLEHGGQGRIVSRNDEVLSVSHSRVEQDFKYEADWAQHVSMNDERWRQLRRDRGSNHGVVAETVMGDTKYAGLSPFAQWRIEVPTGDNEGLERDGIYCLAIECHLEYVAFSSIELPAN